MSKQGNGISSFKEGNRDVQSSQVPGSSGNPDPMTSSSSCHTAHFRSRDSAVLQRGGTGSSYPLCLSLEKKPSLSPYKKKKEKKKDHNWSLGLTQHSFRQ